MFLSPRCTLSALSQNAQMNVFTRFSSVLLMRSDAQEHHSNLPIYFGQSFGLAKSKFSIAGIYENAISLIPLLAPSSISSTRMIIPTKAYNQSQKLIVLNTCTSIDNPSIINSQYNHCHSKQMQWTLQTPKPLHFVNHFKQKGFIMWTMHTLHILYMICHDTSAISGL